MAWATPFVQARSHPDIAQGVIMTVTSGDVTAVGPVVCKYIQTAQEDVERRRLQAETENDSDWRQKLSKWYDERVAELSKAIGTHTDQEICEQLKQHEPDVQGLIAVINRELEIGGYYEVRERFD